MKDILSPLETLIHELSNHIMNLFRYVKEKKKHL